ncbi:MAG: hypothetical protein V7L13_07505 [Nostoc sp.]|uniref:hypothetical protein n=1 Tax=Nostoc sp. TaxID=1180 RepID=UPI002FF67EB4
MKYFKFRLNDTTGNLIYEKDVEVKNVFASFISNLVSRLVMQKSFLSGEHYSAIVIPHYGECLAANPIIINNVEKVLEQTQWIDLCFEEPIQPEKPVKYVTIELQVRERNLIYRKDFQMSLINQYYTLYGVRTLLNLGIVQGDWHSLSSQFFVREDDEARFDRERIPKLEQQAELLVELISDDSEDEDNFAFLYRDSSFYAETKAIGNPSTDDIRIYINQKVMEPLIKEGKLSMTVERGGILVGSVYESTDGGRRIVEISNMIPSEHNASSIINLRYTFESWQAQSIRMKKEFPGKRIVGWYHTHLIDISIRTEQDKIEKTKLFFSRDDLFMHKQFFPEEWYVAMVLDPQGNSMFFQWKNQEIVTCGGYYIFEDVGVAG